MILTPKQMCEPMSLHTADEYAETLTAYAEVVEAVADNNDPWENYGSGEFEQFRCKFCETGILAQPIHRPDCPYLAARRLRGKE